MLTGECWSSPDADQTYDKLGPAGETQCVTSGYQPCPRDPKATDKECVGRRNVNYIYAIEKTEGNPACVWQAFLANYF